MQVLDAIGPDAPTARVVRDGVERVRPAAEVVRGDLVVLAAGDIVPADLRLDEAHRLQVDESALTGESVPVTRVPGTDLSAGTVVVAGRGSGTVTRIGPASALGRIATLVASARPGPTPLQRRLAGLSRVLGLIAVALSAVVTLLGIFAGEPVMRMAITGVSLVVAAVPESLPAVVTLALALGARRMARAHAVARRLHAVETLGSVTVLCSDKTGTVTEGRMAVGTAITVDGDVFEILGAGYSPDGTVAGPSTAALTELARAAVLCNDARLVPPGPDRPQWTAVGDPVEAALLAFAGRCGVDVAAVRAAAPRVREEPFDPLTRRMVTVHATGDGALFTVCKGAPDVVLDDPALLPAAEQLARAGLRVLAIAAGTGNRLRPLGLVGIGDPLRAGAADVTAACARAGIRVLLVTGDHPHTARTIAAGLGVWREGDRVTRGDTDDLAKADLDRVTVFARIRPEQKLDIVAALQRQGHVVAMTGDGVNDAPALRRADIGVAMGAAGTEVARQAGDLVLTDDNLATVVTAVAEGRRVYDNIRRFLRYALSGGVAELLVMLVGPFLGLAVPLLPGQILWINLLTHGLPGVALGAEPGSPAAMARRPRSPQEAVLGAGLGRAVLVIGALIAACTLGGGLLAAQGGAPWQSILFLVLGLAQLGVALAVRAPRRPGGPGNPWLGAAVAASAALMLAAVTLAPLRELLGTRPLSAAQLAGAVLVAALPGGALALVRRRKPHRHGPSGPARAAVPERRLGADRRGEIMTTHPIVVGVDGSPTGLHAVDLAVREAGLRTRPIRVVYANTWASHPAWVDVAPSGLVAERLAAQPRQALDEALARIAATGHDVPATGEVLVGNPTAVLVNESRQAALLVLGHRGHGGLPLPGLGSVARQVAAHASCPVLVGRGTLDATGEVLVGVDGSPGNDAAVGFAFEEAALRGTELLALHAWTGPVSTGPGDMLPLIYDADDVAAEEARVLAEALAGWQAKYPDVTVQRRLVRAHAARALVEATGRAQLVVVGTHGHRAVAGWLVGSVTHALLHQAGCPIVVVRQA